VIEYQQIGFICEILLRKHPLIFHQ